MVGQELKDGRTQPGRAVVLRIADLGRNGGDLGQTVHADHLPVHGIDGRVVHDDVLAHIPMMSGQLAPQMPVNVPRVNEQQVYTGRQINLNAVDLFKGQLDVGGPGNVGDCSDGRNGGNVDTQQPLEMGAGPWTGRTDRHDEQADVGGVKSA